MRPRTNRQELEAARRHTGRVEAQLRQADKRIAELEAENEALQGAIVPILYYFIEATSGEFWVESEGMLDKHGGRGTAQLKRDLKAAYDLLAEILEEADDD